MPSSDYSTMHGRSAIDTDPISPMFDADFNEPWWQGQVIETHTFGSSAASQFLLAGSYFASIFEVKNPSQALSAFPTVLNFNAPGTFTNLGGGDYIDVFGFGGYNSQYQISEDIVKSLGKSEIWIRCKPRKTHRCDLLRRSNIIGTFDSADSRCLLSRRHGPSLAQG